MNHPRTSEKYTAMPRQNIRVVTVDDFTRSVCEKSFAWSVPPPRISDVSFCISAGILQGRSAGAKQLVRCGHKPSELTTGHLSWKRMQAWLRRLGAEQCYVYAATCLSGTLLCSIDDDWSLQAVCDVKLQYSGTKTTYLELRATKCGSHSLETANAKNNSHPSEPHEDLFESKGQEQILHKHNVNRPLEPLETKQDNKEPNNALLANVMEVGELLKTHDADVIADLKQEWRIEEAAHLDRYGTLKRKYDKISQDSIERSKTVQLYRARLEMTEQELNSENMRRKRLQIELEVKDEELTRTREQLAHYQKALTDHYILEDTCLRVDRPVERPRQYDRFSWHKGDITNVQGEV